MWPAFSIPLYSATACDAPASNSSSGSLYDTAVKRWNLTNVSAMRPAAAASPARNTRSHGTNTSSKTVNVSIIL